VAVEQSSIPKVTIIIPVYNEEAILGSSITELTDELSKRSWTYELILAENGSKDSTVALGQAIAEQDPRVRVYSLGEPNYGKALREGILKARGEYVICDEIDLCDVDFYDRAIEALDSGVDLVVGSKRAVGARDRRPMYRRAATQILNGMLRVAVGFKGTDTHGLKAFRRDALLPIVDACVVDKDMFASEFVVRVHRSTRSWIEIPIDLIEKRPPSIHLFRRVPNVLKNIVRLTAIIRFNRDL
jgi:glycosyltransferase involved in cell wall biosynthesis